MPSRSTIILQPKSDKVKFLSPDHIENKHIRCLVSGYKQLTQIRDILPLKSLHTHETLCLFFFKKNKSICLFVYLFIFGCVGSSLLRAGFLQLRRAGATLRCGARPSHCSGFSYRGAWALGVWASAVVACGLSSCCSRTLECRLSSCGAQAQLLHSM